MEMLSVKVPADIAHIMALKLYRKSLISLSKAAEIAGLSLWEMMEPMAYRGVPIPHGPEGLEVALRILEEVSGK